ncbi:MAG: leucine-rich repeat domain-containing protein, partial [Clostridia bacterium]|nr:leucine-rich repeat domain-containing protein [Clostridia bacterium]
MDNEKIDEQWINKLNIKKGMKLGYYGSGNSEIYKDGEYYEAAEGYEEDDDEIDEKRTLLKFKDMSVKVPLHYDAYLQTYLGTELSGYYDDNCYKFSEIIGRMDISEDVKEYYSEENIEILKGFANKIAEKLNIANFKSNIENIVIQSTKPICAYPDDLYIIFEMYDYSEDMNFIDFVVLLADRYGYDIDLLAREMTGDSQFGYERRFGSSTYNANLVFMYTDDGIKIFVADRKVAKEIDNWDIEDYDPERRNCGGNFEMSEVKVPKTKSLRELKMHVNAFRLMMDSSNEDEEEEEENLEYIGDFGFANEEGEKVLKKYNGSERDVVIPDGITKIEGVFYIKNFLGIEFPIIENAFNSNKNLKSVVIPDSVTFISQCAFTQSETLESVKMSNNITEIGPLAFAGCKNLRRLEIPSSVTKIWDGAIRDCDKLQSVVIPSTVAEIGEDNFTDCPNIVLYVESGSVAEKYAIDNDLKYEIIIKNEVSLNDKDFEIVTEGKNVILKKYKGNKDFVIVPNGVTEIGEEAFANNEKVKTIILPNTVEKIGESAFAICENLEKINVPSSVKEIEQIAFGNCKKLKSLDIPYGVTEIKELTFANCKSLESFDIPGSVTKIGLNAFAGCGALTSVTMTDSLTEIGEAAFLACINLKNVVIPSSVTKICKEAFSCCVYLDSIVIPSSVEFIGENVFSDCALVGLKVENGSVAEDYAIENGLKYEEYKDEDNDSEDDDD